MRFFGSRQALRVRYLEGRVAQLVEERDAAVTDKPRPAVQS